MEGESKRAPGSLFVVLLVGFALGWFASLGSKGVTTISWNGYTSSPIETVVERVSCKGESNNNEEKQSYGTTEDQRESLDDENGPSPASDGEDESGEISFTPTTQNTSAHINEVSTEDEDSAAMLLRVTEPWSNVTTISYFDRKFYAGYRNQIMAFTSFVMEAVARNASQILLPSLKHKDTLASKTIVKHETFFDVVHWNSQYPKLPRLVRWDAKIHDQIDYSTFRPKFLQENPESNSTRPIVYGRQPRLMMKYMEYSKGNGPYAKPQFPNKVELTMMNGGIRPNPELIAIMKRVLEDAFLSASNGSTKKMEYMTLHARVEPDMQKHTVCVDKKERNLTQIFRYLEEKFPEPPAPVVFMPINRQIMERIVKKQEAKAPQDRNLLAIENLNALNAAVKAGLWQGRARILELGANSLMGTVYEPVRSTAGAILNFEIAQGGNIFVGTEVSSYSIDLVSTRFYRGLTKNYKYLPTQGLLEWTPKGTKHAPGFDC